MNVCSVPRFLLLCFCLPPHAFSIEPSRESKYHSQTNYLKCSASSCSAFSFLRPATFNQSRPKVFVSPWILSAHLEACQKQVVVTDFLVTLRFKSVDSVKHKLYARYTLDGGFSTMRKENMIVFLCKAYFIDSNWNIFSI